MLRTDITHTTKPSERPFPGARLTVDLNTGIRQWSEPPPADLPPLPEPPLPIPDLVGTVSDEIVEHAKQPRQFTPKTKGWKNNAA